jgi:hypothetical protein
MLNKLFTKLNVWYVYVIILVFAFAVALVIFLESSETDLFNGQKHFVNESALSLNPAGSSGLQSV